MYQRGVTEREKKCKNLNQNRNILKNVCFKNIRNKKKFKNLFVYKITWTGINSKCKRMVNKD